VAVVGTLAYTQVGAHTSYAYLAGALFVTGIGIGSTIAPSMAAAFQAVSRAETPRATSALNAIQRIAGAIGTALFAILLQHSITDHLGRVSGGGQAIGALARQPGAGPSLASAFGATFWVAVALIAVAVVPAVLLPSRARAAAEVGVSEHAKGA
jgi:hypothetical protein